MWEWGCAVLVRSAFSQRFEGWKVEKGSGVLWERSCAGLVWGAFFQRFESWKVENGVGFCGAGAVRVLFGVRFFNGLRVGKLKREWVLWEWGCAGLVWSAFFQRFEGWKVEKGVGFCGSGAVLGLFGVRFFNGLRVGKLKKGVGFCGSGAVRGLCILP